MKEDINLKVRFFEYAVIEGRLEFIRMQVMKEPQTGIALGVEAWTKGEFALTGEQMAMLKAQAEHFAAFVNA